MSSLEKTKRYNVIRIVLIVICLFIGIGAFGGGLMMLIDPTGKLMGMDVLLPYFKVLPLSEYLYNDYVFPGIALIVVNGISNVLAAILLFLKKKSGNILGMIFGITLMLWIAIQFYIFPVNFMDIIYFIFGFIQFIIGLMAIIFYKQTKFTFDEKEYKDIAKSSDGIVIYFSRMGYTKKIAYSLANQNRYEIYEVKSREKTNGTLGFWWCGRYALHKWGMPIVKNDLNLKKYNKVIIVSPTWVFNISSPIREFIKENKTSLHDVMIVLNCFSLIHKKAVNKELKSYFKDDYEIIYYNTKVGNQNLIRN